MQEIKNGPFPAGRISAFCTFPFPELPLGRRAPEQAPLRKGGGAATNEMSMSGKRQASGAATEGVLRTPVTEHATSTRKHAPLPATPCTKTSPSPPACAILLPMKSCFKPISSFPIGARLSFGTPRPAIPDAHGLLSETNDTATLRQEPTP